MKTLNFYDLDDNNTHIFCQGIYDIRVISSKIIWGNVDPSISAIVERRVADRRHLLWISIWENLTEEARKSQLNENPV